MVLCLANPRIERSPRIGLFDPKGYTIGHCSSLGLRSQGGGMELGMGRRVELKVSIAVEGCQGNVDRL